MNCRTFRNSDPPSLLQVWNEVFAGHGGVPLIYSSALECGVFAKPYFDPSGLILAEDNGTCLGFAHAGFGPDAWGAGLASEAGVVCLIGVRPAFRRRGIGAQLLERCEDYLRRRGSKTLLAGPHGRLGPFYLGLYGGSELPGFLLSQADAEPFFLREDYQVHKEILIFRRRLAEPVKWADPRQAARRNQFVLSVEPCKKLGGWWEECVLNPLEPLEFTMSDKSSGQKVAQALAWDMGEQDGRAAAVGILNLTVLPDYRRLGLGRLFLAQLFRLLHDQYIDWAEIQVEHDNTAGSQLCRSLGFELADRGRVYRKQQASVEA